jgi:hypothetical protein
MSGTVTREKMRRRRVSEKACAYPGCPGSALFDEHQIVTDLCYEHSINRPGPGTLPNDGWIDWTAIEVGEQGAREIRMTWVEKDIALGRILAAGGTLADGERNLGIYCENRNQQQNRRVQAAYQIARHLNPAFEVPDGD